MARFRSSFKCFKRPGLHSYWAEFPFFLFGLGKFRRALKHGHQRMGFGVRGLYSASQALTKLMRFKHKLSTEARISQISPLWTVSTTFKYNYPTENTIPTFNRCLTLPALDPALDFLPREVTLYLTYNDQWVSLGETTVFSLLLAESYTQVSMITFNDYIQLNQSFYYLMFKLTF